jgi:hypothetical protein
MISNVYQCNAKQTSAAQGNAKQKSVAQGNAKQCIAK